MTKQHQLELLKNKLLAENPCPELSEVATNLVFGTGNVDAEVVFVGEAPGKKEDESGEPFVGASGRLLNQMLVENNINREDVYITNIVKYRPPNNRDPKPEEKDAFWPYLLEQIAIIRPKIIATLGRHSGLAFNKSLRIGADHGKSKEVYIYNDSKEKVLFVPLYHPAAAIYNQSLKQTLLHDLSIVKELIK
jgi:uracil-DNA glycosylase